jgi:hypothetical protein
MPNLDLLIRADKKKHSRGIRLAWFWVSWLLRKDELKPDKLGILGEWVPVSILNAWQIKHESHFQYDSPKEARMVSDWSKEAGGNPDILVPPNLYIEVKNNGPRSRPRTQRDVIDRFLDSDKSHAGRWLLLCAFNRFNRSILKSHEVDVLEWGIQARGLQTTAKASTNLWFPFAKFMKSLGHNGVWP